MSSPIWNFIAQIAARPAVAKWLIRRAQRTPYSPIIKDGELYMDRAWLFNPYPDTGESGADRKAWRFPISIRIHHIVLPDQDRDLHDHPWNARTIVLKGGYTEARRENRVYHLYTRLAGDTATLKYGEYHRITSLEPGGAWTMFITGRYRGTWGFMVDGAKVPWREYLGLPAKPAASPATAGKAPRRRMISELAAIYGTFLVLALWNWW
ncbi:hypothetical protein [Massilia sp. Root418]|uniref:hypothetical protein n=1 Tax=Massilia sp. Root418 TaxID=1736532 RepID=UPI000A500A98|nr:hypothetical protein [Massilia sp. Root418]